MVVFTEFRQLSLSPVEVQYFKFHFHILPPSKTKNAKSPLYRFPYQNTVCISLLPHIRHMSFTTVFLQMITRIMFCEEYNFVIIILLSVLRQAHSRFQSRFSTRCDVVLPRPISSVLSFP